VDVNKKSSYLFILWHYIGKPEQIIFNLLKSFKLNFWKL